MHDWEVDNPQQDRYNRQKETGEINIEIEKKRQEEKGQTRKDNKTKNKHKNTQTQYTLRYYIKKSGNIENHQTISVTVSDNAVVTHSVTQNRDKQCKAIVFPAGGYKGNIKSIKREQGSGVKLE